jgi:ADP-ribose pyrophosphatase YjhB (NUDIX family)
MATPSTTTAKTPPTTNTGGGGNDAAAHCTYCGARFAQQSGWPRTCAGCGRVTYRNPLPVVVVLLPVYNPDGLLVVRRSVAGDPGNGRLALPGGYVDVNDESWQHAAARELREETGVCLPSDWFSEYQVRSAPNGTLLLFVLARAVPARTLPPSRASGETSEVTVIHGPAELAFPLHTDVARHWFAELRAHRSRGGRGAHAGHRA